MGASQRPQTYPSVPSRKRKPVSLTQEQNPSKRLQTSPSSCIHKEKIHQAPATEISEDSCDPLRHWIETGTWRKDFFEQDSQVREDFERGKSPEEAGESDWLREHYIRESIRKMHALPHLQRMLARKRSSFSLGRKNSQSSLQTPSDQLPREVKSAPYKSPDYAAELEEQGSYMYQSKIGITDSSRKLRQELLKNEQTTPQDTLFRDDLFHQTCHNLQDRNEAMVIRDIGLLITPSAQTLATYGAIHLQHLYETTNEGWNTICSFPLHSTRPQPDFSVGFGRSAFTQDQRDKLKPFVGRPGSRLVGCFMPTTRMYFPFLTCEVKCGVAALDIADRQNAHSMTVAVRAFVELFRLVKRERELHREILTFSISHDHRSVRIYGHYPVIDKDKTTFYRHPIRTFDFTEEDGREKWTTYKFVKNIYDHHMPNLHKLICSAVNELPADISFDLSQSASFSESRPQSSRQSNADLTMGEDSSRSSFQASPQVTPTMSFNQAIEPPSKKPRSKRGLDSSISKGKSDGHV